jgi:hypothetical protein
MDIVEEIKFPSTNRDWIQKVLIGGIINIIPIINFLSSGYNLKVMGGAIEGRSEMPEWRDWGNLFVKGLIAFVISIVYMIIPIGVILISLGGMVFTIFSELLPPFLSGGAEHVYSRDPGMAIGAIAGAIGGILIGLVLMLIFGFLVPMALAMFIKEDNLGAAFRFGEVISRIRSVFGDYLTVYLILIVLWIILGLFGSVPVLGFFIVMFGGFYIAVIGSNMFGKVYARSIP